MPVIQPTTENLKSERATQPLTAWLIHAAKSPRTMTYGDAKRQLENDCGFGVIFTVAVGKVAGAAMNKLLECDSNVPLLNVLLVRSDTGLPGSGAVGYLARRYPDRRWLRRPDAHKDDRWRTLIQEEAARVYGYPHWDELYRKVYNRRLPASDNDPKGKEKDGVRHGRGGEGANHRALRLRVLRNPSLVRKELRPEATNTEVELLSGDRVDVVSIMEDRTVAIEVKSKDSDWFDLRRGVYQCVKYRAVMKAQDIRRNANVESWLVTEIPLPDELKKLARRLGVRTKAISPG